jgi:hypothetical protein
VCAARPGLIKQKSEAKVVKMAETFDINEFKKYYNY